MPGWPAELVVEADAGGQGEEPLQDALSQPAEGARAVALEGEQVLAGPEDRLDALADRREVRTFTGLIRAPGPDHEHVELSGGGGELATGVALVADQYLTAARSAREQLERDLALVAFGRRG